ncbi:MAG TPA: thymidine phosphorylase, partial [Aciduliprofundum sp.]|nr:thymidine phosphorylase [Aciduliprofundum sp.]
MEFRVKKVDLEIGENSIIMNREDAVERGLNAGDRVRLFLGPRARTVIVHLSSTFVSRGEIGIFASSMEEMGLKPGDTVRIAHAERPASIDVIKKKMRGEKLGREEIFELVRDIVDDNLTDVELTAYVVSVQTMGMDMDEIAWLTEAMVKTGDTLDFEGEIFDVHSIGGVPGNKYALIAVPTAA